MSFEKWPVASLLLWEPQWATWEAGIQAGFCRLSLARSRKKNVILFQGLGEVSRSLGWRGKQKKMVYKVPPPWCLSPAAVITQIRSWILKNQLSPGRAGLGAASLP